MSDIPAAVTVRRQRDLIAGGSIALEAVLVGGAGIWVFGALFSELGGAVRPEAAVKQLLSETMAGLYVDLIRPRLTAQLTEAASRALWPLRKTVTGSSVLSRPCSMPLRSPSTTPHG
ncbi:MULTISPECIES: hypothetical protein [Cryobacterium]|uniref:ABC transmembrane type-1 domain-containing protein n=1 Tax=Cryobacterium breve TaxID=1259258 RepID=A0ABY2J853_9MICO|nr:MULTISPECIES: hypothetical protein [Cryobacterium]TFC91183.1 hypothetical protein E3T20_14245 [Cryobacterium sp. TmT3-12]TFD01122.1 hypothetical protein E3O65_02170 [Cryobacterium breve]